jgi:ABC-type transport system involved in cytochrome c biogenesis permease component
MNPLAAVMTREAKIRATDLLFIFWDLLYPLGYLLVFGVGINASLGFTAGIAGVEYNAFFLAGVLSMASFGIAANTSWSFFLDRDNGIFYEMLTYPMSRSQYLLGKVLFNVLVGVTQSAITVLLAAILLDVPLRAAGWPLRALAMIVGTGGWFFFYAIFALRISRNDAFNTITSIFYFLSCSPARYSTRSSRCRGRFRLSPMPIRSPGRSMCATRQLGSAIRRASHSNRPSSCCSPSDRSRPRWLRSGDRSDCLYSCTASLLLHSARSRSGRLRYLAAPLQHRVHEAPQCLRRKRMCS